MKVWRKIRGTNVWRLEGYRIAERSPTEFEVYCAQAELPFGQPAPKGGKFGSLNSAKEWGRMMAEKIY